MPKPSRRTTASAKTSTRQATKVTPRPAPKAPVKKAARKSPPQTPVRQLKHPEYRSFRLTKSIKTKRPKVVGSVRLLRQSFRLLGRERKLFAGLGLVYTLLTLLFVRGFAGSQSLSQVTDTLHTLGGSGQGNKLADSITVFGTLLGNNGTAQSEIAGLYRSILVVTCSLAIVWALRHTAAGMHKRIRDAFYQGMTPLVPFLIVILVIGVQLLPVVVANFLYSAVVSTGLAATAVEQFIWLLLAFLLIVWSLYMVSSSIFALYIVTLPDMTPRQALRGARNLVRYRRWMVMRKVLFLPFAVFLILVVIVGPAIYISTTLADWTYFVVSSLLILVIHSYVYSLYRELIKDADA